jgi:hypothetical protein
MVTTNLTLLAYCMFCVASSQDEVSAFVLFYQRLRVKWMFEQLLLQAAARHSAPAASEIRRSETSERFRVAADKNDSLTKESHEKVREYIRLWLSVCNVSTSRMDCRHQACIPIPERERIAICVDSCGLLCNGQSREKGDDMFHPVLVHGGTEASFYAWNNYKNLKCIITTRLQPLASVEKGKSRSQILRSPKCSALGLDRSYYYYFHA